jgi:hypothetical protein
MSVKEDVPDIEYEYHKTLSGYKKIRSKKVELLEYTKHLKKTCERRFYLSLFACVVSIAIFVYALFEINDPSTQILSAILIVMTIGFSAFFFYRTKNNDFKQTIEDVEVEIKEVDEKLASIMS